VVAPEGIAPRASAQPPALPVGPLAPPVGFPRNEDGLRAVEDSEEATAAAKEIYHRKYTQTELAKLYRCCALESLETGNYTTDRRAEHVRYGRKGTFRMNIGTRWSWPSLTTWVVWAARRWGRSVRAVGIDGGSGPKGTLPTQVLPNGAGQVVPFACLSLSRGSTGPNIATHRGSGYDYETDPQVAQCGLTTDHNPYVNELEITRQIVLLMRFRLLGFTTVRISFGSRRRSVNAIGIRRSDTVTESGPR